MISVRIVNFFFLTFAIVLLALAKLSQKPQCINSKWIEKITFSDLTYVQSCDQNIVTDYSKSFEKKKWLLQAQIVDLESWFSQYWTTETPLISIAFTNEPTVPQVQGKQVLVWERQFKNSWSFQKILLEQRLKNTIQDHQLRAFVADFYVRVWNQNRQRGYGDLNSYLSHQWWLAYQKLSAKDKIEFLRDLPQALLQQKKPVNSLYEHVIQLSSFIHNPRLSQFKIALESFGGLKSYNLQAEFDLLLLSQDMSAVSLAQLDKLQKQFPEKKLGIWNGKVLYHVPSKSYLSAAAFEKVKSQHFVWEICGDINFRELFEIPAEVRKVLLVRNCDQREASAYASYLNGGVENFAASHAKVQFVLFDVPSLKTQKDLISAEMKVFSLLMNRSQFSDFFTKIGWQGEDLNTALQMYAPKTSVDSIQYFRVQN